MRSVETAALVLGLHGVLQGLVDVVAQHGSPRCRVSFTGNVCGWVAPECRPPLPRHTMTATSKRPHDPARKPQSAGAGWAEPAPTALFVLADGTVLEGFGFGAPDDAVGEVCFNTAMTGYQEILTDPSYAGQIITFTFPHIGNVGTNEEDIETRQHGGDARRARRHPAHAPSPSPSNYRATKHLDAWLKARGIIGLSGIDTRALTALIRDKGMPNAVIAHEPTGEFDLARRSRKRRAMARPRRHGPGADGDERAALHLGRDAVGAGTRAMAGRASRSSTWSRSTTASSATSCGCSPAPAARSRWCRRQTSAEDILALKPDGVFLSNGPGDPAATGEYAVPVIKQLIDKRHADLRHLPRPPDAGPRASAARPMKMHQGHHGANHPVKDLDHRQGRDHLDEPRLRGRPGRRCRRTSTQTHVSLFDGSNCGIALKDKPVFSVQYHPEASPGPRDSHYLFTRFVEMMRQAKDTKKRKIA